MASSKKTSTPKASAKKTTPARGKPSARRAASRLALEADPALPADEADITDGRRNRTVTTRKRIVAALKELVHEGAISPTAEEVSARADVGLRTVFRHFEDMDALYREVNGEIDAIVRPMLRAQLKGASWQERLIESIDLRGKIFERLIPFFIFTQVHRHESAYLGEEFARSAAVQRDLLARLLPRPVLADRPRFEALLLMLSMDAWVRLRREQGLGPAVAIKAMKTAAQALIRDLD